MDRVERLVRTWVASGRPEEVQETVSGASTVLIFPSMSLKYESLLQQSPQGRLHFLMLSKHSEST